MGYALFAQYGAHLIPCIFCFLLRVAPIGIGLIYLAAALHRPVRSGSRIYGTLVALTALTGAGISIRHLWVPSQPAGTVAPCGAPLEFLLQVLPLRRSCSRYLRAIPCVSESSGDSLKSRCRAG